MQSVLGAVGGTALEETVSYPSTAAAFGQLVSVVIVFVLVLVATYFVTRWVATLQKGKLQDGNIEVIETYRLAQTKYVQIIRTGNRYLVIAVSKDTVEMLTELTPEELVLKPAENTKAMPFQLNFKEILERAKKGKE